MGIQASIKITECDLGQRLTVVAFFLFATFSFFTSHVELWKSHVHVFEQA